MATNEVHRIYTCLVMTTVGTHNEMEDISRRNGENRVKKGSMTLFEWNKTKRTGKCKRATRVRVSLSRAQGEKRQMVCKWL